MNDLVDMVRHADPLMLDALIFALRERFTEVSPEWELITISVEKKRDYNEQLDAIIAFLERLKKK